MCPIHYTINGPSHTIKWFLHIQFQQNFNDVEQFLNIQEQNNMNMLYLWSLETGSLV